jgi:hypothetical protein
MYEKQNQHEEILSLIRVLDTKINMVLSDIEDLRESVTQMKFIIDLAEEDRQKELEKTQEGKWKRVKL